MWIKKIINNKFFISALGILLSFELLYLLLPVFFNCNSIQNYFKNKISVINEINIDYDKFNLKTYPDFTIEANTKNFKLSTKDNSNLINGANISLKVDFFPLHLKKVNIKSLNANNVVMNGIWYKEKRIGFKSSTIEKLLYSLNISLDKKKSNVHVGNHLIFIDNQITGKNTEFRSDYFILQLKNNIISLKNKAKIDFHDNATVYNLNFSSNLNNKNNIILEGKIKDLYLNDIISFLPEKYTKEISKIKGVVDIEATHLIDKDLTSLELIANDVTILAKKLENSIITNGTTTLKLIFKSTKDQLIIEDGALTGEPFELKFNGAIKNFISPIFNVKVDIIKAKIDAIYNLLPACLAPSNHPKIISSMKKYNFYSDLTGTVDILGDINTPKIFGNLSLKNIYFKDDKKNLPKSFVNLTFEDNIVNVIAKIYTNKSQFADISGYSNLYGNEYGEYNISSTNKLDLSIGRKMLLPISEMFDIDISILPLIEIQGIGNLQLNYQGNLYDKNINGVLQFDNTNLKIKGLETNINNAKGSLNFKNKDILIKTDHAYIDNKNISIKGTATLNNDFDLKIAANNVEIKRMFDLIKNSDFLKTQAKLLTPIEFVNGKTAVDLNIKGNINKLTPETFNKNVLYSGTLDFNDAQAKIIFFSPIIEKLNGTINFNTNNIDINLQSDVDKAKFFYVGAIENGLININIHSKEAYAHSLLKFLPEYDFEKIKNEKFKTKVMFDVAYNAPIDNDKLNYDKLKLTAKFVPDNEEFPISVKSGVLNIENGNIKLEKFKAFLKGVEVTANAEIKKAFSTMPIVNMQLKSPMFNLDILNSSEFLELFPDKIVSIFEFYENYQGNLNINVAINNNKMNGLIKMSDINLIQKQNKLSIIVKNGDIKIKDNNIFLDAINAQIDSSPVFLELSISNIFSLPYLKGYLTTTFNDNFVSGIINPYMTYPLRIKGAPLLTVELQGNKNKFYIQPRLQLTENSDISFMGANIDDIDQKRELKASIIVEPDSLFIRNFVISKYINSSNNKSYPIPFLKSMLKLEKKTNGINIKNFAIKTIHPTNAKLFNLFFKKSVIKDGFFDCNLKLSNNALVGNLTAKNISMPYYNLQVDNIKLNNTKKDIAIDVTGKVYDSKLSAEMNVKNSLNFPINISNLNIQTEKFNTNQILDAFSQVSLSTVPNLLQVETQKSNFTNETIFTIQKGTLIAENILFRDLIAKNLYSEFSLLNDSILQIDNLKFKVADGEVSSKANYNFKNGEMQLNSFAKNVDANYITEALFNVKNQIFGNLDGKMQFSTRGKTDFERLQNTFGTFEFLITDGKMPKLGSMEYLLKAGNLIKSGLFGVSVNKIINLIVPLNSGEFDKIQGSMQMQNGVAKEIQIFSKGPDLSIYLSGEYDIPAENADMEVWGKITNNKLNFLGPIGNASLNTFFKLIPWHNSSDSVISSEINKIPDIKNTQEDRRIFHAKINGNINADNYVSTFNWVEE